MISPIRLTPTMDQNTMVSVINQNFAQLESENRTKVIRDETGTNRVLIGRDPTGKYVVAITIEGKDVLEELERGT